MALASQDSLSWARRLWYRWNVVEAQIRCGRLLLAGFWL